MKSDQAPVPVDPALVQARAEMLGWYSPYHFLRVLPAATQQVLFGTGRASRFGTAEQAEVLPMAAGSGQWLLQQLSWDSAWFGTPVYKVFTGIFSPGADVLRAAATLRAELAARGAFYAFSVVPAEDTVMLQALSGAGWRLMETRLTYYRSQLDTFDYARYPVRPANGAEAPILGAVAARARNAYDRFHADPWFGQARADAYLARYAENAVANGLADTVLVPDLPGQLPDAFLAISDLAADARALGVGLSRVLLTAVGPANRGWHVKLLAETVHRAQAAGHEAVLMTTQATNHAVFRSCEKLGFRLGSTSHVLACHGG